MLPVAYATPAIVILLVGGVLACFAGFRLFRLVLAIYGFILGAAIATTAVGHQHAWGLLVAVIAGGVLGALLMIAAYFMGVGFVGAGLAALVINVVWKFIGGEPPTAVLAIGCVIGALLALKAARYVVIFGTALGGSWTAIVALLALGGDQAARLAAAAGDVWILYPLDPLWSGRWWYVPVWIALALAGALIQLKTSRKSAPRRKGTQT